MKNRHRFRSTYASTAKALAFIFILLHPICTIKAQSKHNQPQDTPPVLPQPALWLQPGMQHVQTTTATSKQGFASNYMVLDQQALRESLISNYMYTPAQTIALVLVPRFDSAVGARFLQLGNVVVFDDHSRNGFKEKQHAFKKDEPIILVFRSQAAPAFGKAELECN